MLPLISVLACIGPAAAISYAGGGVVVAVNTPEGAWADVHLAERIDFYAASINRLPIKVFDLHSTEKVHSDSTGETERLSDIGQKFGCRYVIEVRVEEIDLEKRKVTILPQVIYRYRIFAVLRGCVRIYDTGEARMISSRDNEYKIKAKDRWQFTDDNEYDADLHIKSDLKAKLFSRLEARTASGVHEEIKQFIKGIEIDI